MSTSRKRTMDTASKYIVHLVLQVRGSARRTSTTSSTSLIPKPTTMATSSMKVSLRAAAHLCAITRFFEFRLLSSSYVLLYFVIGM